MCGNGSSASKGKLRRGPCRSVCSGGLQGAGASRVVGSSGAVGWDIGRRSSSSESRDERDNGELHVDCVWWVDGLVGRRKT